MMGNRTTATARRLRGRLPRRKTSRPVRGVAGLACLALGSALLAACGTSNASTGPVTLTYYLYPDSSAATVT